MHVAAALKVLRHCQQLRLRLLTSSAASLAFATAAALVALMPGTCASITSHVVAVFMLSRLRVFTSAE